MKYKEIEIPFSEMTQELRNIVNEFENLSPELLQYYDKELRIKVENNYYSPEMREIIDYCRKTGNRTGEQISKTSRNIFEAYQKATQQKATDNLKRFKRYLEGVILRRVMESYQSTK